MRQVMANVFFLMVFGILAHAMDNPEYLPLFMVNDEYLDSISLTEECGRTMTLAQTQIFNVAAWAYHQEHKSDSIGLELQDPITSSCPFSLGEMAPPHQLAKLINERLPKTSNYFVYVVGYDVMSPRELLKIIESHIKNGQPMLIYFNEDEHFRLATIVGLAVNNKNIKKSIILMKTYAHMNPSPVALDQLIECMDLSKNREILAWMKPSSRFFRNKDHATLLNDLLAQLHNFTFITFAVKEQTPHHGRSYPCQLL